MKKVDESGLFAEFDGKSHTGFVSKLGTPKKSSKTYMEVALLFQVENRLILTFLVLRHAHILWNDRATDN